MKSLLYFCWLIVAYSLAAAAQPAAPTPKAVQAEPVVVYAETITAADLQTHLNVVAGPKWKGAKRECRANNALPPIL